MGDKKKALLAYKEELLKDIMYYEKRIEEARSRSKSTFYCDDDDSDTDSETFTLDTGPSIGYLREEQQMLQTCLHATEELTGLHVLQSEVNVMVEDPVLDKEPPVEEEGTWSEITAECRIDLVPFSINFYVHQPERQFGPPSYRGLRVCAVKEGHDRELAESVLARVATPADATEVLRSYAHAHRSRRTTLARLAEMYPDSLFMEPMPNGGYSLKCAQLLDVSWSLESRCSPVAPFHHRLKFDLDYMEESYVKIISQAHRELSNPSLETDERTALMATIIATCLEAQGETQASESESDNQRKRSTSLDEDIEEPVTKKHKKDSEIMAPPKSVPKKSKNQGKQRTQAEKETIVEEENNKAQAEQRARAQGQQKPKAQGEQSTKAQAAHKTKDQDHKKIKAQSEQTSKAQEQNTKVQGEQNAKAQSEHKNKAQGLKQTKAQREQNTKASGEQNIKAQGQQRPTIQGELNARVHDKHKTKENNKNKIANKENIANAKKVNKVNDKNKEGSSQSKVNNVQKNDTNINVNKELNQPAKGIKNILSKKISNDAKNNKKTDAVQKTSKSKNSADVNIKNQHGTKDALNKKNDNAKNNKVRDIVQKSAGNTESANVKSAPIVKNNKNTKTFKLITDKNKKNEPNNAHKNVNGVSEQMSNKQIAKSNKNTKDLEKNNSRKEVEPTKVTKQGVSEEIVINKQIANSNKNTINVEELNSNNIDIVESRNFDKNVEGTIQADVVIKNTAVNKDGHINEKVSGKINTIKYKQKNIVSKAKINVAIKANLINGKSKVLKDGKRISENLNTHVSNLSDVPRDENAFKIRKEIANIDSYNFNTKFTGDSNERNVETAKERRNIDNFFKKNDKKIKTQNKNRKSPIEKYTKTLNKVIRKSVHKPDTNILKAEKNMIYNKIIPRNTKIPTMSGIKKNLAKIPPKISPRRMVNPNRFSSDLSKGSQDSIQRQKTGIPRLLKPFLKSKTKGV